MSRQLHATAVIATMLGLAGCATVSVDVPRANQRITTADTFRVTLASHADVTTFRVTLDGEDITSLFGTARPGETVTALPPPLKRPHPDVVTHTLEAHALSTQGTRPFQTTTIGHEFTALVLKLAPVDSSLIVTDQGLVLRVGQTTQIRIELPEASYRDLDITVSPAPPGGAWLGAVAVEGMGASEPARVVMNQNTRFATFTMRGVAPGDNYVNATASATDPGSLKYRVVE